MDQELDALAAEPSGDATTTAQAERDPEVEERRQRLRALWLASFGGIVTAGIVIAGIALSSGFHPVTGRGAPLESLPTSSPAPSYRATSAPSPASTLAPVVQTTPDSDSPGSPVERVWADARTSINAPTLTRTDCLDSVAKDYATAAAKAGSDAPANPTDVCGSGVRFGYMTGFDKTGVGQATAAMSMGPKGPSPLVASDARKVGYALVPSHGSGGAVNGYVLAWVVSK